MKFFLFSKIRLYHSQFPLELLLLCPIGFGSLWFYLSLGIFVSTLISLFISWLFSVTLFILHMFLVFSVFILVFIAPVACVGLLLGRDRVQLIPEYGLACCG